MEAWPGYTGEIKALFEHARVRTRKLKPISVESGKGQSIRRTVRMASIGASGAKGREDKARCEPDAGWGQRTW